MLIIDPYYIPVSLSLPHIYGPLQVISQLSPHLWTHNHIEMAIYDHS